MDYRYFKSIQFKSWGAFKYLVLVLAIMAVFAMSDAAFAQIPLDIGVTITSTTPPQLNLVWSLNTWQTTKITTAQLIYRRVYGTTSWGSSIASLAVTANSYSDTTITPGVEYEYELEQDFNTDVTFFGDAAAGNAGQALSINNTHAFGFICAGINLPYNDNRGKLLLLVDNTMSGPLATEIAQLQQDLAGDGWTVLRTDLPRSVVNPVTTGMTVGPARLAELQEVKSVIQTAYNDDPTHVKEVYILGHLPVPYSGDNNPDGHTDHIGAWPADTYYADMTGNWTDTTVNDSSAADAPQS